MGCFWV